MNLAVITARGGSKRIPRKNVRDFCGRPILAYAIEAARRSELFDVVMVSTEDEAIAAVARQWGAQVPFLRSAKNADDYAGTADVLQEVVRQYAARGQTFDWLCCVYPTAPFVTADKLREAMRRLQAADAEALMTVVRYSYPVQRSLTIREGHLAYRQPEYVRSRSQDLPPVYHDAGQFYFYKAALFLKESPTLPQTTIPYILDEIEAQDIDTESDWEIAELKYRRIHQKKFVSNAETAVEER